jgi:putative effector of murein hydrolase
MLSRSISTPFAVAVSRDIGGVPELTALFVIVTGLMGASVGQLLLHWLPLRSALARGALFGMGAHSLGVAAASRLGGEEGAIAGLVMIFAGISNVVLAPLVLWLMR